MSDLTERLDSLANDLLFGDYFNSRARTLVRESAERVRELEAFIGQWAGVCLFSNAGCHPNHPNGQCRACAARELLGLPHDPDGTKSQAAERTEPPEIPTPQEVHP